MKIPFKEISFSLEDNNVVIRAPWMEVVATLEEGEREEIQLLLKAYPTNIKTESFQKFLSNFTDFDFFYNTPREDLCIPSPYSGEDISKGLFLKDEKKYHYTNLQDILNIARSTKKLIDPVTLFQNLRKENLLYDLWLKQSFDIYGGIEHTKKKDERHFKGSLAKILNQTYYVTYNFSKVVQPKHYPNSPITSFIEEIYAEEVGHHKLIYQTLREFDEGPDEDQVLDSIKALMKLIEYSLRNSPLGFALIISNLEGDHYPDEDPLCKIIESSSFAKSVKGLKTHFEINKKGDHKNFGLKIVTSLENYLTEEEACIAINIVKTLNNINYLTDKNLVDYINI